MKNELTRAAGLAVVTMVMSLVGITQSLAQEMPAPSYYRDMVLRTRKTATFSLPLPGNRSIDIKYGFEWDRPQKMAPDVFRLDDIINPGKFDVNFWDRIFTTAESEFSFDNSDFLPLTCVFVSGQDNRFSNKTSPLIPDYVFKVYVVANDFSCTGPINPGWPGNGRPKENWETYLYYEIRDPTVMLPTNAIFTYRRNAFNVVLLPN